MALQSMTGFARVEGRLGECDFVWELRSVNGKGLDLRFRLPAGFEHLEPALRGAAARHFKRGNIQLNLTVNDPASAVQPVVNEAALEAIIALAKRLEGRLDARKPALDGLLNIRGVLEFREPEITADERERRDAAVLSGFDDALMRLKSMREREGAELVRLLAGQVEAIAALTALIEETPSRSPEAIRERLAAQVTALMNAASTLDRDRLHMEAALLATKADLREEIDRLNAHVEAARALLRGEEAVGRRLDFLAQEFNRETNTICSKSNAVAVTAAGLDLKVLIDQFREQLQNLE